MFLRAFALTWFAYFGLYLCRKNFSVLMPFLKLEQGFTSAQLADVLFFYSVLYTSGQLLLGPIVDRWGARRVVSIGAFTSAFCSFVTGWWQPLWAVQGVNGLAQATGWPGLLKMARDWFPETNKGVVLAWWGTHMVLGGLAGSALAAFCASYHWRLAAIVPAVMLSLYALVFALYSRDGRSATGAPAPIVWPWSDRELWTNRRLVAIAIMYFFTKLLRYAFLFWLPLYMTEALGYKPVDAGYASAIYEFVGFGGVLFAGYWSERGSSVNAATRRFSTASTMMFVLMLLCFAYPHLSGVHPALNLAVIGLIGAFTFGPDTLMAGAGVHECVPPDKTGSAGGLVNGLGSIGQIISPYLVSALSVRYGWPVLFGVLGLAAMAGGLVLATETRQKWRIIEEKA